MKLVSLKHLLSSLLGIGFLIYKIMTFDGVDDLIWIVLFCYLTFKCLMAAFSQAALDEDLKEANQKKALRRDLFGKFAYIVADIPLIMIFLICLLAVLCPVSTALGVVFIVLLLLAAGYALLLGWYLSKHKRLRMERGQWGAAVLSAEDQQAWRRSGIWHIVVYGIIVLLGILYLHV